MEETKITKTRKPRTKKQPVQAVEQPAEEIKVQERIPMILAIDPGFVNCAFAILQKDDGKFVYSTVKRLRPEKKLTQSQVDGYIVNNCQKIIEELFGQYHIQNVIVELQLGQFSATNIQLALIAALPQDVSYIIQHSKLKLKHPEAQNIKVDNEDSKKYHQNKHMSRALVAKIYPDIQLTGFDEYDAILHGLYFQRNHLNITCHKKCDLI